MSNRPGSVLGDEFFQGLSAAFHAMASSDVRQVWEAIDERGLDPERRLLGEPALDDFNSRLLTALSKRPDASDLLWLTGFRTLVRL